MFGSIIASAKQKANELATRRIKSYRELLRAVATGGAVTPDAIVAACEAAGVPVEQFERDAELFVVKVELRKLVDAVPAAETEKLRVDASLAKLERDLEKFTDEIDSKRRPLMQQRNTLVQTIINGESAKRRLFNACSDPEKRSRLAAINVEMATLQKEREAARVKLHDLNELIKGRKHEPNDSRYESQNRQLEEAVPALHAKIRACDAEGAKLVAEREALESLMAEV